MHGQHLFISLSAACTRPIIGLACGPHLIARRLKAAQTGESASNLNSTHNARNMA